MYSPPPTANQEGFRETAKWYLENEEWLLRVASGEYAQYYAQQYGK